MHHILQYKQSPKCLWYIKYCIKRNTCSISCIVLLGDEFYHHYQLRSDDVYATHLVVEKQQGRVPPSYTAVFLLNNSLQYQVHTHILPTQVFRRERLYLPDGIQMYVHKSKKGQPAFVQCVAKVPNGDMQNDYFKTVRRTFTTKWIKA